MITRAKHSSPFDPRSISGCQLWLDAADVTTLSLSGSNVSQWRDKSGNSNTLSVINTSSPTRIIDSGLPVISFASGNVLRTANNISYAAQTTTVFIVAKLVNANTDLQMVFAFSDDGVVGDYSIRYLSSVLRDNGDANDIGFNGNYFVNGTKPASTLASAYSSYHIIASPIHATRTGSSRVSISSIFMNRFFTGLVAEVIVFTNNQFTTSQRQQVEGYLAWKWGLTASLPQTHPFRNGLVPFAFTTVPFRKKNASLPFFDPRTISECVLWLDAAEKSTFTLSGSNITQWRDKSGLGRNATAVGTIPLSSSINGISTPGYSLNVNTYFSGTSINTGSTLTAFAVYIQNANSSGNNRIVSFGTNGSSDWNTPTNIAAILMVGNNFMSYRNGRDLSVIPATFGVPSLSSSVSTGQSNTFFLNGTAGTTVASSGNFNYSTYFIGTAVGEQSVNALSGTVGEVVIYNSSLTTSQRQQVEGYLAHKWGLQRNLPSNHLHKQLPPNFLQLTVPIKSSPVRLPSFLYPSTGYSWYDLRFTNGTQFTDVGAPRPGFNGTMTSAYSIVNGPISGMRALSIPFGGTISMPTGYTSSNFTIAFWINFSFKAGTGLATYQYFLLGGRLQVHQYLRQSQFGGADINNYVYDPNGSISIEPILSGVWYHMVFTYNTSINQVISYVNGVRRRTATQTINAAGNWTIGNTGLTFGGSIADLRVISSLLTETQVENFYKLFLSGLLS
jgi:hypothetical protein